jgi:nicastrin
VKAMYVNIESFSCVRLLNLSGEIGCSSEYLGLPLRGD